MAFEKIIDLDCDVTIALGGVDKKTGRPNPTKIEGYYLGSRQVADKKKKSGFSFIYAFQTPKGNVGVWGKTNLDNKMASVAPGTMVRVTQSGKRPTPNGDMYLFLVEQDRDNTIPVNSTSVPTYEAEADSSVDSYEAEAPESAEAPADEVPYTPPVAPKQPARTPSAESQARVQAVLNRTRPKSA
jgi:hypothetical protein